MMNENVPVISEELKALLNEMPCGVEIFRPGSAMPVFSNDEYFRLVGYTETEYKAAISNGCKKLFFDDDAGQFDAITDEFERNKSVSGYEYRIVRKDGGVLWLKIYMSLITLCGEKYIFCSFINITREKDTYNNLGMVAENVDCSVSIFRIENGIEYLVYANDRFYDMLGVTKDGRGNYYRDAHVTNQFYVSEMDRKKTREAIAKSYKTGKPGEVTFRFTQPGGQEYWLSRHFAIVRQDSPNSYLLISAVTDVTDRINTELKLAAERRRYQLAVDELKAAVFEWDFSTNSFFCSDSYKNYAMSRETPDAIIRNEGPLSNVHHDDLPILMNFFRACQTDAPRLECTLRLKMTDDTFRWSRLVAIFDRDNAGKLNKTLGIIIDINDDHEKSFMLDSIINELPGGVAVYKVTPSGYLCEYFSDGFAALSGRTREEINSLNSHKMLFYTVIDPSDIERFVTVVNGAVARREPVNLAFRIRTKDGEVLWIQLDARKMKDEKGCPVYYCVLSYPTQESALYRSIVEESANGVIVAERGTRRVCYINEQMFTLCGFDKSSGVVRGTVSVLLLGTQYLLSREQVDNLTKDKFLEFHSFSKTGKYLAIRAKAIEWNGIDSYIVYVSDESREHNEQERLRELLNDVPSGIGIYSFTPAAVVMVYRNDGYYRLVSMTRAEHNAASHGEIITMVHPEDAHILQRMKTEIMGGNDHASGEYRMRCGDGGYIWVRMVASVIKRESEGIIAYCSYTDFTETMAARHELEKSNAIIRRRYSVEVSRRKALEKGSVISGFFNATRNQLVGFRMANGEYGDVMRGMDSNSVTDSILKRMPFEEERAALAAFMDRDSILDNFKNGKMEEAVEYRSIQPDGHLRWMRSSYYLIQEPGSGDVLANTIVVDIDEAKKKNLVAESVIDKGQDYVALVNVATGLITMVRIKPGLEYLHDVKEHGEDILDDDRQGVVDFFDPVKLKALLEKSEIAIMTFKCRLNGEVMRKELAAYYLDDSHEDIVLACRDITELYGEEQRQKQILKEAAEKADRANSAKSDFLSRMSHDIRTPMNGIMGLTRLALDSGNVDEIHGYLRELNTSSRYLLGLLNDILTMTKMDEGEITLRPEYIKTSSFISGIVTIIKSQAEAKCVTFTCDVEKDVMPYQYLDPLRTEQIIMNILNNAVKFTPRGGTVSYACGQTVKNGQTWSRHVFRDTGVGMSAEFMKTMFDPFTQENRSQVENTHGTGLGLAICKKLCDIAGGTISVSSEQNEGTTFIVELPAKSATEEEYLMHKGRRTASEQPVNAAEILSGKHVLLCEDHPLNRMIAAKLLEESGLVVETAENGREGCEMFESSAPYYYDAVLMDIRMPVMDGLEAAKRIRASGRADSAGVPVIAMTANAFDDDVKMSLNAGMNAHLSKPIDVRRLYQTLSDLIRARKS